MRSRRELQLHRRIGTLLRSVPSMFKFRGRRASPAEPSEHESCKTFNGETEANSNLVQEELRGEMEAKSSLAQKEVRREMEAKSNLAQKELRGEMEANSNVAQKELSGEMEANSNLVQEELRVETEANFNLAQEEVRREMEAKSSLARSKGSQGETAPSPLRVPSRSPYQTRDVSSLKFSSRQPHVGPPNEQAKIALMGNSKQARKGRVSVRPEAAPPTPRSNLQHGYYGYGKY